MKRLLVMGLLSCAACGSDAGKTSGSGSASGTVGGHGLTVRDAVFAVSPQNQAVILVADREGLCALLASATPPTGETTALVLALTELSLVGGIPSPVPPTAGEYGTLSPNPATSGRYFFGGFGVGTGCDVTSPAPLSGGTVTVTQMGNNSGTHAQASFHLEFGSDALNGNFDATYCAAVLNPGAGCDIGTLKSAPFR